MRRPWWFRADTAAAGVAAGLAVTWLAIAAASAVSVAPGAAFESREPGQDGSRDAVAPDTARPVALDRAVALSLFRIDRRRPPQRYVPPGSAASIARAVARAPRVALTGTVVYPGGGGLALVHVDGRSAMVKVGDTISGLTLRSVAREEAVFERPGGATVVLRVPRAGG